MTRKQLLPLALCAALSVPALAACSGEAKKAEESSSSASTGVEATATAGSMTATASMTGNGGDEAEAALGTMKDWQKAIADKNPARACDYAVDPSSGKPANQDPASLTTCQAAMKVIIDADKDQSIAKAEVKKVDVNGDLGSIKPEDIDAQGEAKRMWDKAPMQLKKVDGKWYVATGTASATAAVTTS